MPLWRLALNISFGLMWTVCSFVGGLIAGDPIGEVILVTFFVAFITGTLQLATGLCIRWTAKYPPTLD